MRTSINCPSCGAPRELGAVRCPYCGSLVQGLASRQQQEARIAELGRALRQRKPTFDELVELGELYLALGRNAHAEQCLKQAIELDGDAPRPRLLLCLALLGFNQPVVSSRAHQDEIESQFEWLEQNHPELPEVEWLGHYLELERQMQRGDWQSGIERGRAAVERFPENYLLQFMYGLALAHFGKVKEAGQEGCKKALHCFRLAAELNPAFEPAVRNVRALEDYLAAWQSERG